VYPKALNICIILKTLQIIKPIEKKTENPNYCVVLIIFQRYKITALSNPPPPKVALQNCECTQ